MRTKPVIGIMAFALVCLSFFAYANQATTTMTWYVPSVKSHSIAYGGTCSSTAFFFPESAATLDNDGDGNASQILPQNDRDATVACQSDAVAGMTITNNGTTTTNIDANFAAAMDANVWLKVWKGDDSGCGTDGLGGWELICSVSSTTDPVTTSACKDFNAGNATAGTRLITSLEMNDTNQLCFSGELRDAYLHQFPARVAAGDHNATWQTSTDFS